jgi:hypothetical protein
MYCQETPDANICERMEILLQVCKIIFLLKSCARFAFSSRSSLTVMDLSLGSLTADFGTAPAQPLVCSYYCQSSWWRLVSTIYLCFPTCAQVWPFRRCWCMIEMRSEDALEGWNVETDLWEVKESKMRTWSPKVWQWLSCLLMPASTGPKLLNRSHLPDSVRVPKVSTDYTILGTVDAMQR